MKRFRISLQNRTSLVIATLGIVALCNLHGVATSAPPPKVEAVDAAPIAPAGENDVAARIKALEKLVADLQSRAGGERSPHIIAAGTATWQMGAKQSNTTFVHVPLAADIAAKVGDDYIVLISSRFPNGGYPLYTPFWRPAKDGFDVTMADVTLGPGATESFVFKVNRTFLIDWIVVKK